MKSMIAIIGRPNVGKSTLFNRLSEQKKAIVIDVPGATRDRNYSETDWGNRTFTLIDTGGFEPVSSEEILIQMREQTSLAIEQADAIIFLLDGKEGLTPADREITNLLRRTGKPVFFAVNKIDGPKHENFALEFYALGIDKIYTLSAQHGLGIGELMDDVIAALPPAEPVQEHDKEGEEEQIRIAVIGRPNTGKSSLINKILGYERTIVNPLPGTTRDSIDTPFELGGRRYLLVDTAGIRRKSRISLTLEKYSIVEALRTLDRSDVALIMIDAVEGIAEQDAKIAGLALEKGVLCIVAVNKWDLIQKDNSTIGEYVRKIKDELKFLDYAPIVFISALTGQRVQTIFEVIESAYAQFTKRVQTSELNKKLQEFLDENPPPRHRNKPNKISYATQTGVKPPTFVLFAREPKAIHFSYRRYLANRIREEFGFEQTPLRIFFRKKNRE